MQIMHVQGKILMSVISGHDTTIIIFLNQWGIVMVGIIIILKM